MNSITIILLIIGVVFFVASFFVSETLGTKELSEISKYTEEEIKVILGSELEEAKAKVTDIIDEHVDLSVDSINLKLGKITDEKIMAINDYYETVKKETESSHKEVTFLYNMLNEKHEEVVNISNELSSKISELSRMIESFEELINKSTAEAEEKASLEKEAEEVSEEEPVSEKPESAPDIKELVLDRLKEGQDPVDIARDLGIGYGEVKLYFELYQSLLQESSKDET